MFYRICLYNICPLPAVGASRGSRSFLAANSARIRLRCLRPYPAVTVMNRHRQASTPHGSRRSGRVHSPNSSSSSSIIIWTSEYIQKGYAPINVTVTVTVAVISGRSLEISANDSIVLLRTGLTRLLNLLISYSIHNYL